MAGRNEHFRSFRIGLPGRKRRADGTEIREKNQRQLPTQALGKTALFKSAHGPRNETYQRVLRASPIQASNEARITAIASGLAPENEIIAFQPVSNALTSTVDEISRISLGKNEAADVDVMAVKGDGHMLAYCTDDSVYIQKLPNSKGSGIDVPARIYQCPESTEATPPSKRPKFRALRLLTPKHMLLLQNQPGRTGANVLILRINITGNGHITLTKYLNKSIKLATGFDTCILRSPESEDFQAVVARRQPRLLHPDHLARLHTYDRHVSLPRLHLPPRKSTTAHSPASSSPTSSLHPSPYPKTHQRNA